MIVIPAHHADIKVDASYITLNSKKVIELCDAKVSRLQERRKQKIDKAVTEHAKRMGRGGWFRKPREVSYQEAYNDLCTVHSGDSFDFLNDLFFAREWAVEQEERVIEIRHAAKAVDTVNLSITDYNMIR